EHARDARELRAGHAQQAVVDRHDHLAHDLERLGGQDVVRGDDAPGQRVLDREQAVGDRSARDRGSNLPELAAGHRLDRPGEEAARRLLAERPELTLEGDAHCRTCVAHVRTPAPSGSGCSGAATNASACSARCGLVARLTATSTMVLTITPRMPSWMANGRRSACTRKKTLVAIPAQRPASTPCVVARRQNSAA